MEGCSHQPPNPYNGPVYFGYSSMAGVYSKSVNNTPTDILQCSDPKFNEFMCFQRDDFQNLVNGLINRPR